MGASCFSVTGNPAVVRSPAVTKIENLKVHFLPVQEGSGTPSPVNIRKSNGWSSIDLHKHRKNILDLNNFVAKDFYDTTTSNNVRSNNMISVCPGAQMVWTAMVANGRYIRFYDKTGNYQSSYDLRWYNSKTELIFTVPNDSYYIRIMWYHSGGLSINDVIASCPMLEYGEKATAFEPYKAPSIIPIALTATGKNLIHTKYPSREASGITFTVNADWSITTSGTASAQTWLTPGLGYLPEYHTHLSPGTYFLSGGISKDEYAYLVGVKQDGTIISFPTDTGNGIKLVIDYDVWVYPQICITKNTSSNRTFHIQLERGESATAYEAYSETSVFYGGYIDLVDGKVVAEWKKKTFTDLTQWAERANGDFVCYEAINDRKITQSSYDFLCSAFNPVYQTTEGNPYIRFSSYDSFYLIILKKGSSLTLEDIKSTISNGNMEIYYPLATPITYYLPAQELNVLRGISNYWSSALQDVDVNYELVDSAEMIRAKERMQRNSTHIESEEGAIASFVGNMTNELISGEFDVSLLQGGSGDSSPNNPRPFFGWDGINAYATDKNLLNVLNYSTLNGVDGSGLSNGVIEDSAVGSGSSDFVKFKQIFRPGTYTISCKVTGDGVSNARFLCSTSFNGGTYNSYYKAYYKNLENGSLTVTIDEPFAMGLCLITASGHVGDSGKIYDIQFETGSTATEYKEYTGNAYAVTFPVQGKNLFDEKYTGIQTTASLVYKALYVGNGVFTASSDIPLGDYADIFFLPGNVSTGASTGGNDVHSGRSRTVTSVNGYVTIAYRAYYGGDPRNYHTQIEAGNYASVYMPYTNAIYGGKFDPKTGLFTVTHAFAELVASGKSDGGAYFYNTASNSKIPNINNQTNKGLVCNRLKPCPNVTEVHTDPEIAFYANGIIRWRDADEYMSLTVAEYNAAVISDRVKIAYEIKDPYTIQLTPMEIHTLKGANRIWADCGNTAVKFWKH